MNNLNRRKTLLKSYLQKSTILLFECVRTFYRLYAKSESKKIQQLKICAAEYHSFICKSIRSSKNSGVSLPRLSVKIIPDSKLKKNTFMNRKS